MIRPLKNCARMAALAVALSSLPFASRAIPAGNDAPAPTGSGNSSDPVVATGKGFSITRSQVDDAYLNFASRYAAAGRQIPEDARAEVRSNLLDYLVMNQILLQRATSDDRSKAGAFVDERIASARKANPEAFDAQIKVSGMTSNEFRKHAVDEQVCQRVLIRETSSVSDADVRKFYDDNPSKFEEPERVRAAHILISTQDPFTHQALTGEQKAAKRKLAEEVLARARKGEDFAALVKEYSDDPGSKDTGGEYTFPRGKMVREFEDAAFTLKVGQISDLVETQYGYHIIKLLEKLPPSKAPFDTVTNDIRNYLVGQQVQKAEPTYAAKLKADYAVKIIDPSGGQAR